MNDNDMGGAHPKPSTNPLASAIDSILKTIPSNSPMEVCSTSEFLANSAGPSSSPGNGDPPSSLQRKPLKIHLRLPSATTALGTLPSNAFMDVSCDSPIPSATDRLASLLSALRAIPASEVHSIADSFETLFKELISAASPGLPSNPAEVEPSLMSVTSELRQLTSIVKGLVENKTEVKSASFASIASQQGGWVAKRPRVVPASPAQKPASPSGRTVRKPFDLSAPTPGLSDDERRQVLGQSSPKLSGPFTAVFIEGISKPNDCGVRFVADFLEDEFKFPTINVVNVAYFGDGLSELIIPVASLPSLQAALAGSSVEVYPSHDPHTPLTKGMSYETGKTLFRSRINASIKRIRAASKSQLMAQLVTFLEAYRDTGLNTPPVISESRKEFIHSLLRSPRSLAPAECSESHGSAMDIGPVSSSSVQGGEQ